MREHLNGKLNFLQKKILLFFGYSYIAYEHTNKNKNSINKLKRKQSNYSFLKILFKKTSNKIYRGIKHFINILFN